MSRQEMRAGGSTAMSTAMAVEYLSSRDTVTNTRLSCLGQLHGAVSECEGGALPGPAELADIVAAVLRNVPVGNIRVRREALTIVSVLAARMGAGFRQFLPKAMPLLVLRMGDHAAAQRMVAEAATEAFETVQAAVGVRAVYEELLSAKSFEHKSWHVRQQLFNALGSTMMKYGASDLPLEPLLECIISGLNDRAVGTREAAANATVRLYERVGATLTRELQNAGLRDAQLKTLEERFAGVSVDRACVVPLRGSTPASARSKTPLNRQDNRTTPQRSARRPRSSTPVQQLFKTPGSSVRSKGRSSNSPPHGGARTPHSPVEIRSEGDLKAEFVSLSDGLQRPDWNERLLSLRRLAAIVVGGATKSIPSFPDLLWRSPLRHAITAQLADPRSTIVREVCTLIAQLSMCCGDRLCKLAEYWVPELLKLCSNSVQVIRDSADQCIATVMRHTQAPRLLPRVAHAGSSSRHAVIREQCMGFLIVVMTHWSAPCVEKGDSLEDVCESIRLGLNDSSADTRAAARRAYCALSARWTNRATDMQGRLSASVLKALATHVSSPTASTPAGPPTTPMLQLHSVPEAAGADGFNTPAATGGTGDTSPVADLLRSERKARQAAQREQQRYAHDEAGLEQQLQSVQHELRTTSAELEEATGTSPRSLPPPSPVPARSSALEVPSLQQGDSDDVWAGMEASPAGRRRARTPGGSPRAQPPPVISTPMDEAPGFTPPPIVGANDADAVDDDPWSGMVMGGKGAGIEPSMSPRAGGLSGFTPPPIPPTPDGWISDGNTTLSVGGSSAPALSMFPPTPASESTQGQQQRSPVHSHDGNIAGRQFKCVKKSQVRAGMAMDSEKAGVLPVGVVITALEGARNEAGVLRVRFHHNQHSDDGVFSLSGWVSEFAANGQMCLATLLQPEPEPEQPPADKQWDIATTTPSPLGATAPRALSFQSPAVEPDGPPPPPLGRVDKHAAGPRAAWSPSLPLLDSHPSPETAAGTGMGEPAPVSPVVLPPATDGTGATVEQAPQIPEGLRSLTVTCPEGIYGGDLLMVATPEGELELEVVVPDGINPGDLFEVRPDPSLVASPTSDGVPSEGDIVSRMRAAIGLVDDLIERVEDYEIPKVVATVSTTNSADQPAVGSSGASQSGQVGPPAPPAKSKIPNPRDGNRGAGLSGASRSGKRSNHGASTSTANGYHATGSDTQLLLRFYSRTEPAFATEEKVAQVLEIFRAKAEKIGRRGEWREIMYAKLRDKYGRDPRE